MTASPEQGTYRIEGRDITLRSGVYTDDQGTLSLIEHTYGDMDNDGDEDLAVLIGHDSRGSGSFYYINVLLNDGVGDWRLAGEDFLGDRIRVDFLEIYQPGSVSRLTGVPIHPDDYGQVVAAYYAHSQRQSFSEKPALYITRHWRVENGELAGIDPD